MITGYTSTAVLRPAVASAEPLPVFRNSRAGGLPVVRHTPVGRPVERSRTRAHPCTRGWPRSGRPAAPPSPAVLTRCGGVWSLPSTSGARRKARCGSCTWQGMPTLLMAQPRRFDRRYSRDPRLAGVPGLFRHPLRRFHHLCSLGTLAHLGGRSRPHPGFLPLAASPAPGRGGRSRLRACPSRSRPDRTVLTRIRAAQQTLRGPDPVLLGSRGYRRRPLFGRL